MLGSHANHKPGRGLKNAVVNCDATHVVDIRRLPQCNGGHSNLYSENCQYISSVERFVTSSYFLLQMGLRINLKYANWKHYKNKNNYLSKILLRGLVRIYTCYLYGCKSICRYTHENDHVLSSHKNTKLQLFFTKKNQYYDVPHYIV